MEITSRPPIVSPLMADWKEQKEQENAMVLEMVTQHARRGRGTLTRFDTYDPNQILPSQRSPNRTPTHILSSVHFSSDTCPVPPRAFQSKNENHV